MKTIGFVISTKKDEKRRAFLPEQLIKVKNKDYLYFEKGYGEVLGYNDQDYINAGVHVVDKDKVLAKNIICDPKIGDADYLESLSKGQTIFGYIHATQNKDIRDKVLDNNLTAVAWEDMNEGGRHVFWRNNELAGEAAIMHAFTMYGKLPHGCKVAVIGRGNTAHGASKILYSLGADVVVYDRKMEDLIHREIGEYDVIVNSISWDISRDDHIIYKADLKNMKRNSMIIDVSCDKCGSIESSIPTTMQNPIYMDQGVLHYVVDHTPSILFYTASKAFGDALLYYIDDIIEDKDTSKTLKNATIIKNGILL